jgi:hypothetical protein
MCAGGRGVPQDYRDAARWYESAAVQGQPEADWKSTPIPGMGNPHSTPRSLAGMHILEVTGAARQIADFRVAAL